MGNNPAEKGLIMLATSKIGIIGLGHVGAHVANSLLLQGIADELYFVGHHDQKVISEAQDLSDSLSFVPYNTRIVNCGNRYEDLAACDIIVNAAGNVALVAQSRDGELLSTTDSARTFAETIVGAGFNGILVNVANPCDVICTAIWHLTGYDPSKIIGTGCGLDSARLRSEISKVTGISPESIHAHVIGEHGASQVAAWTSATIGAERISELARTDPDRYDFDHAAVEERARQGGYVTFAGKGCTEYAVANCTARICAAVLHNEHAVMCASTLLTGQYGEKDIFASLPCVVGADGIEQAFTPELSDDERAAFHASCGHIRENISKLSWW